MFIGDSYTDYWYFRLVDTTKDWKVADAILDMLRSFGPPTTMTHDLDSQLGGYIANRVISVFALTRVMEHSRNALSHVKKTLRY